MLDLFKNYSIEQIFIFIILLGLAIKGIIDFWDWFKIRFSKPIKEEQSEKETQEKILQNLENHNEQIDKMAKLVNILIESDKDDIKAWITEKHHYFCYELGYIDDYHLQCIEARYKHYKEENGNTFIDSFMIDIRNLPIISVVNKKNKENE